ncbi:hypothetical protein ACFYXH_36005 [Streptomyces sp. NPDC002730]|uniref:hypothetical protein n=1 Tax=Streptomyces sp. NPDC002730 TaxID=3364662 RepID=UPI003690A9B6
MAGGDRVAEIRLGQQYLTLPLRTDVDGESDIGFDVLLPCPIDPECAGYAWGPAFSISLYRALSGDMDRDEDIVCTVHGPNDNEDQDADPEGRADLEAQAWRRSTDELTDAPCRPDPANTPGPGRSRWSLTTECTRGAGRHAPALLRS